MFRLSLLGGLALEEQSGSPVGKAGQRRRLAVLALLALAPRQTLSRDKLLAFLWAEDDTDTARHRLSVVLHELRKVLGEGAIRSVGDDVTLSTEWVSSDVAAFNAALEVKDFETAVRLYAGPFLDGVHIADAPEFEQWVDAERSKLDRAFRTALECQAESAEASGHTQRAVQTWHKLALCDPYNTRVALRYIRALAVSGDTKEALQFARVHQLLLEQELQAEPSAELAELVQQIDAGAIPTSPLPAPPPTLAPAAPLARSRLRRRSSISLTWQPRVLVALGLVVLFLVVGGAITRIASLDDATQTADGSVIVGVLPFANVSDDPRNDYLSDGLTEEMITALGQLRGLSVPSRTSVFGYKSRPVGARQAALELGAAYLMEGSVRRAGDQLRITVRLADATTGRNLWSNTYDRRMDDIFEVQREIAQSAVGALRGRLLRQLDAPAIEHTTGDPVAYDLYLRGRAAWYSRAPDALESALSYFERAVERDSTYALAYAGIADVYNMLGAFNYSVIPPARAFPLARTAATRALRLDPNLPEAHAALGNYLYNYEWKWAEAEQELRRAIALNPGYSMARHWLELVLLIRGNNAEAYDLIRKAREQDPRSALISSALAHHYYYRRDFGNAVQEYRRALELDSTFVVAHLGVALSHAALGEHAPAVRHAHAAVRLSGGVPVATAVLAYELGRGGRHAEARALLSELESLARTTYVAPHFFALVNIGLGDYDRAIRALQRSLEERSGAMLYLQLEPLLDPLRSDDRFRAIVRKVHPLPDQG